MARQADATIDCIGLYCPMPIIETAKEIAKLEPGQVLEILSDDQGIVGDMPAWCETTGHEYLGLEQEDDEYRVYVRKKCE